MGKARIRFKEPDDLPLDAIATVIAAMTPDTYIQRYDAARNTQ